MAPEKKEHLSCIDALKGIGACIVAFVWHYQHFAPQEGSPFHALFALSYKFGWSMVDLFFLLSGVGLMLGYGSRVFNAEISFKDFFLKRLKRLYPLFLITTALVFVLEFIYRHKVGQTFVYPNFDINHAIQNLLLVHYGILGQEFSFNGPSWCIPICLVCYCLFYFMLSKAKSQQQIFPLFSLTAVLGTALIASGLSLPLFNVAVGRGVASFSIGVLLSFAYEKRTAFKSVKLGYCCLFFLLASYLVLRVKSTDYSGHFTLAMTLGFGPMILLSTLFIPWLNAFISNPVFRFLGKISWEIYLFHFPIQCLIEVIDHSLGLGLNYSSRILWLIYAALTIGVGAIYHWLIAKAADAWILTFFQSEKPRSC